MFLTGIAVAVKKSQQIRTCAQCFLKGEREHWIRRQGGKLGLFTINKKNPDILVGNFGSVRTVRVVYHLPKISVLSRRARLDSS